MEKLRFLRQDFPDLYDLISDVAKYKPTEPEFALIKARKYVEFIIDALDCFENDYDKSLEAVFSKYTFVFDPSYKESFKQLRVLFDLETLHFNCICNLYNLEKLNEIFKNLLKIGLWFVIEAFDEQYDYHLFPLEWQKKVFDYYCYIATQNKQTAIINIEKELFDNQNNQDVDKRKMTLTKIKSYYAELDVYYSQFYTKEYTETELSHLYLEGLYYYKKELYFDAYKLFLKSAKLGYAPAQYELAYIYIENRVSVEYMDDHEKWLVRSANQGFERAVLRILSSGGYTENIPKELLYCLKRLGRKGYPKAFYAIASLNDDWVGNYTNYDEIIEYYSLAYYNGYRHAAYCLAHHYYITGCNSDDRLLWYCRAYKYADEKLIYHITEELSELLSYKNVLDKWNNNAQKGDIYSMDYLAEYILSIGVATNNYENNTEKAIQLLTKAANGGYIYAIINLAECYETGRGVEVDISKALYWYKKAMLLEFPYHYWAKNKYRELKGKEACSTIKK